MGHKEYQVLLIKIFWSQFCKLFDDSKIFISRSILKNVNIGLSAQTVEDDLVEEIMAQGGSVSPILILE